MTNDDRLAAIAELQRRADEVNADLCAELRAIRRRLGAFLVTIFGVAIGPVALISSGVLFGRAGLCVFWVLTMIAVVSLGKAIKSEQPIAVARALPGGRR